MANLSQDRQAIAMEKIADILERLAKAAEKLAGNPVMTVIDHKPERVRKDRVSGIAE
jgi:hypothetical protein